jgi:hypothetical protein
MNGVGIYKSMKSCAYLDHPQRDVPQLSPPVSTLADSLFSSQLESNEGGVNEKSWSRTAPGSPVADLTPLATRRLSKGRVGLILSKIRYYHCTDDPFL